MILESQDAVRLITPRLTVLVTSLNKEGKVNAAPFSWVSPVSFLPPMVYLGIAKKNKGTLVNVRDTKEFVVNVVSKDFVQKAIECEEKFQGNKLEKVGLREEKSHKVSVPRVAEAKAVLECKLNEIVDVKSSDHFLIIGEVVCAECKATENFEKILETVNPIMHDSGSKFRKVGQEVEIKRKK